ncbi:hypothetical protein JHK86_006987 [Glycine max]|nr:hypothetical protein JHK86_006987 [Glycine max]
MRPVPIFSAGVSENYANNQGLCGGKSFAPCKAKSSKSNLVVIAGAAVGGVTLATLGLCIGLFFFVRRVSFKKKEEDPEGKKWARSFCMAKRERLLVYKNMPNGNLHDQLHHADGVSTLDWTTRLKIAIGAAKGLAWLHHSCNPRIIHQNISSKYILLDADFEPKISDFGLARLMKPIDTHLSTFVNEEFGDLGYVAPEYKELWLPHLKGIFTALELFFLSCPETYKGNLVEWITELTSNAEHHDAIDESLVSKDADSELFQFLKVACNCVSPTPKERPTMFEVGQIPPQFGVLSRIKTFYVSNNLLMGPVPIFSAGVSKNYANNQGLCGGKTLAPCQTKSSKSNLAVIAGAAAGGVTLAALGLCIGLFFFVRRVSFKKKEEDPEGNKWARSLKGTKQIKASYIGALHRTYMITQLFIFLVDPFVSCSNR